VVSLLVIPPTLTTNGILAAVRVLAGMCKLIWFKPA
jgi:hypothetical protein